MTDHADTIRAALALPSGHNYTSAIARSQMQNDARAALDALLAENQRLREALERIGAFPPEELTNSEVVKRYVECGRIAREALAGDAETREEAWRESDLFLGFDEALAGDAE